MNNSDAPHFLTACLPIVEQLADCLDDAKRAEWLLTVPDGVILRDATNIRSILREASFVQGVRFLDVRFAALNSVGAGISKCAEVCL